MQRLILNWQPLLHFFQEEKKKEDSKKQEKSEKQGDGATSSSYSTSKVDGIFKFLRSPTNKLYCHFLAYTLKLFDPVLVQLQAEEPMIFMLRRNLCKLITDLYGRFVLLSATNGRDVEQVEIFFSFQLFWKQVDIFS